MGSNPFQGSNALWAAERDFLNAQEDAERAAALRQQAADVEATRYLAEMACPDDVTAFGERHGIPTFAGFTWQAGFMAGWRAAQTRKADGTREATQ